MTEPAGRCPGCRRTGTRLEGRYLCPRCWHALIPRTRALLRRKDDKATARLAELYRAIVARTPLEDIEVTP